MAHPLPASHIVAEPWFQYLRSLKQASCPMLTPAGLLARAAMPRSLSEACFDVIEQRLRAGGKIAPRRVNSTVSLVPILAAGRHAVAWPCTDQHAHVTGYDSHTGTTGEDRLKAAAPRRVLFPEG